MKTRFLQILFVFSLFAPASGFAQCDFQEGFENWSDYPVEGTGTSINLPDGWFSLAEFLNALLGNPVNNLVYQSAETHTGDLALGMTYDATSSATDLFSFVKCTERVNKMSGFYKLTGASGNAVVQFVATRYDESQDTLLSVGMGNIFLEPVADYTYFEFEVQYDGPDVELDSAIILITVGGVDSPVELLIDDLNIDKTSAVDQALADAYDLNFYPNPVSDYIRIQSEFNDRIDLQLYDLQGRSVLQASGLYPGSEADVRALPAGTYFLHLQQGQAIRVTRVLILPASR